MRHVPSTAQAYQVRTVHCDHRADDEAVYQALSRATEPLERAWARLGRARRIAVKFNQDKARERVVMLAGQRQQLVSDSVMRATLRLLRERTSAEIICVDVSFYVMYNGQTIENTCNVAPILREFGVRYVDGTQPPYREVEAPAGGLMFGRYTMMEELLDADEVVSVATIKNHAFMGVTGCLKNLFGLMPAEPHARPRSYYHHLVRMPGMLADIGRILDPALNIVDALVGQAGQEWSAHGTPDGRIVDALIAGDQVIATDAAMMHLMGHDPRADWGTLPFHRDRNPLLVAAEGGFGTVDLREVDYVSEVAPQPPGSFYALMTDSPETTTSWRRTMCEQALFYHTNPELFERYAGEYILLQDGEVRWHDPSGTIKVSRRDLAGGHPDRALFFKFVDPSEAEGERYEVYERSLAAMQEQ
ncbi:MAG TPA: DUF362 domain-containing protein [Herpetosiphonaceae bacterium]|nr:DUF362 domain-containing protein [Herpetosiphonaceae bacterium]